MRLCPCRITTSKAVGISSCAIVFAVLIFAAARLGGNGRTNVASARQGAIAIADSEFGRYTADQVIDGEWVHPNERPEKNRWHSGQGKAEPHWIWIRFKQPARIERAVIHPADTNNCPQVMIGEFSPDNGVNFSTLFAITNTDFSQKTFAIEKSFSPVVTDNFRIRILQSSGIANESQLSEVEVFGADEPTRVAARSSTSIEPTPTLKPSATDGLEIAERNGEIEFRSRWLRLAFSKTEPRITAVCWDSLGEGKLNENFLKTSPDGGGRLVQKNPFPDTCAPEVRDQKPSNRKSAIREGNVIRYSQALCGGVQALWEIRIEPKSFVMSVTTTSAETMTVREPFALRLAFDPSTTPIAPLANPDASSTAPLPCLLHAADYGTLFVKCSAESTACLRAKPAVRTLTEWTAFFQPRVSPRAMDGLFVQPAGTSHFELEFTVESAAPLPQLVTSEPRLRSLARFWLNPFQYRPEVGILANNVLSDNAPLCLFTFTDPAVFTPTLPGNIQAIHLARESLDRYFAGANGYGIGREDIQADVYPSLLISAWDVIRVTGDFDRLSRWLPTLEKFAQRIEAQDRNCNGLPESTRSGRAGDLPRPSANWWDVINFGHEDAYVCALDYRAFRGLADLERLAGRSEQAARYEKRADRLRDAYVPTFLNLKTGILAGWKDSEGNLHDYWFVFVNALAITYGLVPDPLANSIIDRIEAKLKEVGYTRFDLGLPGNLVPIQKADYIPGSPGAPQKDDGSDSYGIYQNGGATACYAYFYIQALYQLGRQAEAERLLWPMMETYARGGFQNGIGHGGEWRQWDGKPSGYEGFLADAYYAQMAVFTGHYGITFGPEGFQLAQWSPLKGKTIPLGLQYMGKTVETVQ
jgi:Bacterial alpha-L-rhamnosidase 6 hairpin glycosidase domain